MFSQPDQGQLTLDDCVIQGSLNSSARFCQGSQCLWEHMRWVRIYANFRNSTVSGFILGVSHLVFTSLNWNFAFCLPAAPNLKERKAE